jgi:hypothetical protein
MRYPGVLKAEILEVLKASNRATILTGVARFYDQNEGLPLPV